LSSSVVKIWTPFRVVSTRNPSLPFTVRIVPLTDSVRPSGSFKVPPLEIVVPVPALEWRVRGSSMAAIRLFKLSATYSVS